MAPKGVDFKTFGKGKPAPPGQTEPKPSSQSGSPSSQSSSSSSKQSSSSSTPSKPAPSSKGLPPADYEEFFEMPKRYWERPPLEESEIEAIMVGAGLLFAHVCDRSNYANLSVFYPPTDWRRNVDQIDSLSRMTIFPRSPVYVHVVSNGCAIEAARRPLYREKEVCTYTLGSSRAAQTIAVAIKADCAAICVRTIRTLLLNCEEARE